METISGEIGCSKCRNRGSDSQLHRHHGHTFCQQVRASDETKNRIIIASSGSGFADDQRLAFASGFDDSYPKPVMEEELFEILRRRLQVKWVYAERCSGA
jgi:CheY-like chemotaxis protein